MKKLFSLLLGFASLASPINTASATIINVPYSQPSIQAGIDYASPGDTVLVQPGRYVENIDFKGKDIVVGSMFISTQDTLYISQTIIDGNKNGSVVTFKTGETEKAELCGVTITGGDTLYDPNQLPFLIVLSFGGGIYCFNASPHLHHLIIERNITDLEGGGMYLEKSNSVIEYSAIRNNSAVINGGGFYIYKGNNIITNCKIENNHGTTSGALCYQSKVTFFRVLFTKNLSNHVIETSLSTVSIINCTIAQQYSDTIQIFYSDVNIINSILWNSSPQITIFNDRSDLPISHMTVAFSDIKDGINSVRIKSLFNDQLLWKEGNIGNDPNFKSDNAFSLNLSSPCLDAGTAFYQIGDSTIVNLSKSEYKGIAPDIGAFEIYSTNISSQKEIKTEILTFPNPFNDTVSIKFGLSEEKRINLSIFSIGGQKVIELVSKILPAGKYLYQWNGRNQSGEKVASGVYILRLDNESNILSTRIVFLK
jgi:hypothetical protein